VRLKEKWITTSGSDAECSIKTKLLKLNHFILENPFSPVSVYTHRNLDTPRLQTSDQLFKQARAMKPQSLDSTIQNEVSNEHRVFYL
jgi:hypothetical protein